MKKIKWLFVATLSAGLLITSCGKEKEEETPTEKESTLKPEEHKSNIESEGIAFVKNMDAAANLQTYDVITEFMDLMTSKDESPLAPINSALNHINSLKSAPNLKSFKLESADNQQSMSQMFNENTGIYTWNPASEEWVKKASTTVISYSFKTKSGSTASISLSNFSVITGKNQDASIGIAELPTSLKLAITLGTTELCSFSVTGEYYDNDTPKYLQEVITLEGFNFTSTLNLRDKTKFILDNSFKYNSTIIFANGLNIDGNIDYDAIIKESEKKDGPSADQNIVNSTNAYFQIGNIKADALFNVKAAMQAEKAIAEKDKTTQKQVDLLNANTKLTIKYADKNEIIARGEFYVTEEYDYYDEVNTTSPAMRMVFTDKSAIDGDYFQNGFGDMITEMNTIITKMNKNYGLELEPMENK